MAVSTATITIFGYPKGIDNTQRFQVVRGTIAVTPGDYPTVGNSGQGGYQLSWGSLSNANGAVIESVPLPAATPSSTGSIFPVEVDIQSSGYTLNQFGTGPSGFIYVWDSVKGNMHIFVTPEREVSGNSGPLIEFAGPLSNAIVTDTIQFTAYFARNN